MVVLQNKSYTPRAHTESNINTQGVKLSLCTPAPIYFAHKAQTHDDDGYVVGRHHRIMRTQTSRRGRLSMAC